MRKQSLFALTVMVCLGAGSAAVAQESAGTAERGVGVGPFSKDAYPTSLVERPLTLPEGTVQIDAGFNHAAIDLGPDGADASATGLGVGLIYGITDELEASLVTGIAVDPDFEFTDAIDLRAAYLVVDTAMVDVAPSLGIPLRFQDEADLIPGLTIGARTRIAVAPQLAFIVGDDLIDIGLESEMTDLDLNLGVIVQPIPQLGLRLTTQVASIAVSGDMNDTQALDEVFPLELDAVFAASNQIDVSAGIAFPHLGDAGDLYTFLVGASVRL